MPTYSLVNLNVLTQATNGTFEGTQGTWGLSALNATLIRDVNPRSGSFSGKLINEGSGPIIVPIEFAFPIKANHRYIIVGYINHGDYPNNPENVEVKYNWKNPAGTTLISKSETNSGASGYTSFVMSFDATLTTNFAKAQIEISSTAAILFSGEFNIDDVKIEEYQILPDVPSFNLSHTKTNVSFLGVLTDQSLLLFRAVLATFHIPGMTDLQQKTELV